MRTAGLGCWVGSLISDWQAGWLMVCCLSGWLPSGWPTSFKTREVGPSSATKPHPTACTVVLSGTGGSGRPAQHSTGGARVGTPSRHGLREAHTWRRRPAAAAASLQQLPSPALPCAALRCGRQHPPAAGLTGAHPDGLFCGGLVQQDESNVLVKGVGIVLFVHQRPHPLPRLVPPPLLLVPPQAHLRRRQWPRRAGRPRSAAFDCVRLRSTALHCTGQSQGGPGRRPHAHLWESHVLVVPAPLLVDHAVSGGDSHLWVHQDGTTEEGVVELGVVQPQARIPRVSAAGVFCSAEAWQAQG